MYKRQKIEKIYNKIMISSEQTRVLSEFIQYYADNNTQKETLVSIINEKSKYISRTNEKLALMFKL